MLAKLIRKLMAGITTAAGQPSVPEHDSGRLRQARERYEAGDIEAARGLYEEVLRRDGDHPEAQYNLGVILGRAGRYTAAAELLGKVVAKQPQSADALNALGNVAKIQEHWADAEEFYRRALAIQPEAAAVWSNLGLCLREAGKLEAAESALHRALELAPDFPEALLNLAMVAADLGRPAEARTLLQQCLAIEPSLAEAHTGLAHLLLQNGEFAAGWREYEWRFRCLDAERQREYSLPRWDGRLLHEYVLLIRAEQGLGDQLMFASCLPDAIAHTRLSVVECEPRLVNLFARSFPQAKVFPYHTKREPQWRQQGYTPDYQIHLGSLPALFRRQATDFQRHSGYLHADSARVQFWRARLAGLGTELKIGISWRGGAPRTRSTLRLLALAEWLPVLRQAATFISLQYGDCKNEIDALERTAGVTVHHWQEAISDYDQTAALVAALDCVISVQTAVAHLAGALGKSALVLLPAIPEWRYMSQAEIMLWYPTVKLLRQRQRGDWRPVIDRVAELLAIEISDAAKPAIA